ALAHSRRGKTAALADDVGETTHAVLDLREGNGGEGETKSTLATALAEEGGPRREGDPALDGAGQEGRRFHALGQLEEEGESALGLRPRHTLGHAAAEGGEERVAAPRILAERAGLVAIEETLATEVIDGGLDERARVDVRELLRHLEALD